MWVKHRQIHASNKFRKARKQQNKSEALRLSLEGYTVEPSTHPNGAFFAHIGNHPDHELNVGRIFAENGFSFTLDREGNKKYRINGRLYTLPSLDGHIERLSHEIVALQGEPDSRTVVRAISHSHKAFVYDQSRTLQADIAITIAPKGSKYTEKHIGTGVKEFMRQLMCGETKARPLLYLHVNETSRTIEWWKIGFPKS